MENTNTLTTEQRRRTIQALTDTCRLLEKEMRYSPDLRKQDVLDRYNKHIAHLENILETGVWVI